MREVMSISRALLRNLGWVLGFSPIWLSADPVKPAPVPTTPTVAPRPVRTAIIGSGNSGTVSVVTNRAFSAPPTVGHPGNTNILRFDAMAKHVDLAEGERTAAFVFSVTNLSSDEVTISYINTSCGCTAGKLPAYPWKLGPGEGGFIDVSMDLTGKFGLVTKTATVVSSMGSYALQVSAKAPMAASANTMGDRSRNLTIAAADRQAVFRNDCASCHVQPTLGKTGRELYTTACGICHEAEHRAQMVPDLRTRLKHTDRNYWMKWISEGRQGSLMPAFSAKQGGILSDVQIASLVDYLEDEYKKNPPPPAHAPTSAATSPAPVSTTAQ